jgi:hypothetical protein
VSTLLIGEDFLASMNPELRRTWPAQGTSPLILDLNVELKGGNYSNARGMKIDPVVFTHFRRLPPRHFGGFSGETAQFAGAVVLPLYKPVLTESEFRDLRARGAFQSDYAAEPDDKRICPLQDNEQILLFPEEARPVSLQQLYATEKDHISRESILSSDIVDQLLLAYAISRAGNGDHDAADRLVACYQTGLTRLAERLSRDDLAKKARLNEDELFAVASRLARKFLTGDTWDDVLAVMRHVMNDIDRRPRATLEAMKKAVAHEVAVILGSAAPAQKKSRGYYVKITKDPALWVSVLNHGPVIPSIWTQCVVRRRIAVATLMFAFAALPRESKTLERAAGFALAQKLAAPKLADYILRHPDFNAHMYDPGRSGNLTSFLLGGRGRAGLVELRLRDFIRMMANQAGYRARGARTDGPEARQYRISVTKFDDLASRVPVEAVDPLQACEELTEEALRNQLSSDDVDDRVLDDIFEDPDADLASRAARLSVSERDLAARIKRLQNRCRQTGLKNP